METVRIAPDGAHVTFVTPEREQAVVWSGGVKIMGHNVNMHIDLAPVGEHEFVVKHEIPGAHIQTFRRSGFDLKLIEAADRSDSRLFWAGPFNEASTSFPGPAPREQVLNRVVSMVTFKDSPDGATVIPVEGANLQQVDTMVVAATDNMVIFARSAAGAPGQLPHWRGTSRGAEEVWKQALDLDEEQAQRLSGTPHQWRYTFANDTTLFDVVFPDQAVGLEARNARSLEWAEDILSTVRVTWAG